MNWGTDEELLGQLEARDMGAAVLADPDRVATPASVEGIEVESIFEVDAKERTPCTEGESDCGDPLDVLEPGHPTLPPA